jgi:hypothetical protein
MDYVDDYQGTFSSLDELNLQPYDQALLRRIAGRFDPSPVRYFVLERGRSSAIKVVAKPETLFPLLIKLDTDQNIRAEVAGDQLLDTDCHLCRSLRSKPLSTAMGAEQLPIAT